MYNRDNMTAGSWSAIFYAFCKFIDEILHGLNLDRFAWAFRFCQWSHRKG
jgi:hypothetical protein